MLVREEGLYGEYERIEYMWLIMSEMNLKDAQINNKIQMKDDLLVKRSFF